MSNWQGKEKTENSVLRGERKNWRQGLRPNNDRLQGRHSGPVVGNLPRQEMSLPKEWGFTQMDTHQPQSLHSVAEICSFEADQAQKQHTQRTGAGRAIL